VEYNAIVKRISELLEIVTDENYDTIPQVIELDFLSELVARPSLCETQYKAANTTLISFIPFIFSFFYFFHSQQ